MCSSDLDSDHFDESYLHLFVWESVNLKVLGAYRLFKLTPQSVAQGQFYTASLFNYPKEMAEELVGAAELGRAFVVNEAQRDQDTLPLLWRGIGEWLTSHPEIVTLIGTVTLSNKWSSQTQLLLMRFLGGMFAADGRIRPRYPALKWLWMRTKIFTKILRTKNKPVAKDWNELLRF